MEITQGFAELGAEAIRLLCGHRRRVDPLGIRRAFTDAMLAWPGDPESRWWKWLVETGRGLNYTTRVIDASPRDVLELVRHGVGAATLGANDGAGLLVLIGYRRRKVLLCELPGTQATQWQRVSPSELLAKIGGAKAAVARRWVILDPVADDMPSTVVGPSDGPTRSSDSGSVGSGHRGHAHPSPWSRLWDFLRPEWPDIWIVLVFASFIGLLTLATPIAVEALVNTVAFGTFLQPLIVLSVILLTFLGFAATLRFLQRFVIELIQRRLFARVVGRMAWQLPRVRLDAAEDFSPELLNRFFDVVTMQKIFAQLALDGLTVVLTIGLGMIVLAFYHPWLLAFDASLLVVLFFNVFVLGRGAVRTSIAESKCKYAVAGWLEEIVRCPIAFKSGGVPEFALARADRLTTDYLVARQSHYRVLMRQIASGLALEAVASAVLLGLGGYLVIQGQMTLGQLVASELIVTLIVASVAKLDKQFEGFYDLLTSMDKLGHLFDLPVESSLGIMDIGGSGGARLSLRHVSLAFGGGDADPVKWSFDASPGELVAVTGTAGCGKSLLLDSLYRLREPSSGRIVLNDLDVRDLRIDVLRQKVSLVRGIELLPGTLAENVHLDRPEITTNDLCAALRRVGLGPTSDALHVDAEVRVGGHSWNLDTPLASDGRPLSESQARRLILARALVGKPRLLLIDGLLDALADEDAARLLDEFKSSRATCTVLIATSRRQIIQQCDRTWDLSSTVTS